MLLPTATLALSACGGGGGGKDSGGSNPPPVTAPSALSYTSPVQAVVGTALDSLSPKVTGTVSSYSVSPALPAGLSLATTTGVISGTPTEKSAQTTYTITASNAGGNTTFGWVLTVKPAAPTSLTYSSPLEATVGTPIPSLTPTVQGTVESYSVAPALPAGLSIDRSSGIISGTATQATAQASYKITAANSTGSTSFDLSITVVTPPVTAVGVFRDSIVSGLGYVSGGQSGSTNAKGEFTYEVGKPITFAVGKVTLGTAQQGNDLLTPVDLVPNGTGTSDKVLNIVRFLLMLDKDGDPENGIEISAAVRTAAASWPAVDFGTNDLPGDLAQIIPSAQAADGGGHVLSTAATARSHLAANFVCTHSGVYPGYAESLNAQYTKKAFSLVVMYPSAVAFYSTDSNNQNQFMTSGTPGFDPSLNGSFAGTFYINDNFQSTLDGKFSDLNNATGNWFMVPQPANNPDHGTYVVTRQNPSISVTHRLVGMAMNNLAFPLELNLEMNKVGSATVTGLVFIPQMNKIISLTGSLTGTALGATGDSAQLTATYDANAVSAIGTLNYSNVTCNFNISGCRLR